MRISRLVLVLGVTSACQDTASPPLPLAVSPTTLELLPGDTARIATTDSRVRVTWRSAVPTVATVDAAGLVTAVTPGATFVWAIRGADTAAAHVRVVSIKCAGAPSISPPNALLVVGDTLRVAAADGCSPIGDMADWVVSDPSVATVTARPADGRTTVAVITARAAGQAVVRARSVADPTLSATMALVVKSP